MGENRPVKGKTDNPQLCPEACRKCKAKSRDSLEKLLIPGSRCFYKYNEAHIKNCRNGKFRQFFRQGALQAGSLRLPGTRIILSKPWIVSSRAEDKNIS
jgi:hypothetical protein